MKDGNRGKADLGVRSRIQDGSRHLTLNSCFAHDLKAIYEMLVALALAKRKSIGNHFVAINSNPTALSTFAWLARQYCKNMKRCKVGDVVN